MSLRLLMSVLLLAQVALVARPSIVAKASDGPRRNYVVLYYDDALLFAARGFGDARDAAGSTEPGLFVHSRQHDRWIEVLQISTAGGRFGKSTSDDPAARAKLNTASVWWDYTPYSKRDYIEQPMRTPGSVVLPERIHYQSDSGRYELKYMTSWGVPSAETVLYINPADLVQAFEKGR